MKRISDEEIRDAIYDKPRPVGMALSIYPRDYIIAQAQARLTAQEIFDRLCRICLLRPACGADWQSLKFLIEVLQAIW